MILNFRWRVQKDQVGQLLVADQLGLDGAHTSPASAPNHVHPGAAAGAGDSLRQEPLPGYLRA